MFGRFRAIGTAAEPDSMLTTIYPAGGGCRVAETAIGTPLRTLLSADAGTQAWLVGGYHGSWLPLPGMRMTGPEAGPGCPAS
jgi:hypothetical protein